MHMYHTPYFFQILNKYMSLYGKVIYYTNHFEILISSNKEFWRIAQQTTTMAYVLKNVFI